MKRPQSGQGTDLASPALRLTRARPRRPVRRDEGARAPPLGLAELDRDGRAGRHAQAEIRADDVRRPAARRARLTIAGMSSIARKTCCGSSGRSGRRSRRLDLNDVHALAAAADRRSGSPRRGGGPTGSRDRAANQLLLGRRRSTSFAPLGLMWNFTSRMAAAAAQPRPPGRARCSAWPARAARARRRRPAPGVTAGRRGGTGGGSGRRGERRRRRGAARSAAASSRGRARGERPVAPGGARLQAPRDGEGAEPERRRPGEDRGRAARRSCRRPALEVRLAMRLRRARSSGARASARF